MENDDVKNTPMDDLIEELKDFEYMGPGANGDRVNQTAHMIRIVAKEIEQRKGVPITFPISMAIALSVADLADSMRYIVDRLMEQDE